MKAPPRGECQNGGTRPYGVADAGAVRVVMDESLAAAVDVMRANGIAHRLLTVLRQQGEIESESASAERPALSSAYAQMHAILSPR